MSQPRMMILFQPKGLVLDRLRAQVEMLGLDARLGEAMFPTHNWHQTLCGPFDASEKVLTALKAAGDAARAAELAGFTLRFNRIRGDKGERIHWSFKAQGRPKPFDALLQTLRQALEPYGLADSGHSPHITISYRAPEQLESQAIAPVSCPIDELQLAERTSVGRNWRYQILYRWALSPSLDINHSQLDLFN